MSFEVIAIWILSILKEVAKRHRGKVLERGNVMGEASKTLKRIEELRRSLERAHDQLARGEGIPAEEVYAELDRLIDDLELAKAQNCSKNRTSFL